MEVIEQFQKQFPEIDLEQGLLFCGGDKEFYLELFQDYVELSIKEELTKCLSAADYKNYCILIHGFKNSSYSMGATAIGDFAYEIEILTRENMPEEIYDMQAKLFAQYDSICSRFKEIMRRK